MARALARGWNRPVLVADPVGERAQALVAEVGGEALASNAEVAQRADLVVLCHKPAQLADVASEVAPHAKAVASILAATPLADSARRLPGQACLSLHPLASRRGSPGRRRPGRSRAGGCARRAGERAVRRARHARHAPRRARRRRDGPDVVRSRLRRARRRGADRRGRASRHSRRAERGAGRADARRYRGAARRRGNDTLAVRREVASPGGVTARGLAALERGGLRAAFSDALDAVLEPHDDPRLDRAPSWRNTCRR